MSPRARHRRHRLPWARRLSAVLGATVALALASAGVVTSQASWNDREHVRGTAAALNCATGAPVNSTSWARVLSGAVSGQSLDPVAAIRGLTVANTAPTTSSTASGAAPATDLGSDAWSSALSLSALNGLSVGAGVTLPFGANTGSYTQWGRDTALGLSAAASGAVTAAAGGLASLGPPSSSPPQLADLTLSTLLDPVLTGGTLPATATQLANVHLSVGALGALVNYDSCAALWSGAAAPGTALSRQYLIDSLGLSLTSSVVSGLGTTVDGTLGTLQTTLNGMTGSGGSAVTGSALAAVQSTLTSALNLTLAGIGISLGRIDSLTATAVFSLTPVRALLAQDLTDGVVSVNLTTGTVTADLASLFGQAYGTTGLNGLAPNTSLLTPAVLNAIATRVGSIVATALGPSGTIGTALTKAINDATVTVRLGAHLNAVAANTLVLTSTFSGTLGGFTGVAGYATPTVVSTLTVDPGVGAIVAATLNAVLSTLTTGVVSAVATTVLPTIGASVVQPVVKAVATSAATSAISGLTGTTVPAAVTSLGGVLAVLGQLVAVTANGQPDQANPVGAPDTASPGRYFETALKVGIVNAGNTSLAALYLANASVGPNSTR